MDVMLFELFQPATKDDIANAIGNISEAGQFLYQCYTEKDFYLLSDSELDSLGVTPSEYEIHNSIQLAVAALATASHALKDIEWLAGNL